MNSSIVDYQLASAGCCYDVIALTETWLTDSTVSQQIFDSGYEVFRCDRSPANSTKACGGGVLLAARCEFKVRLLQEASWNCVEQLWVAMELEDRTLYICVVYIPPDRTRDLHLLEAHTQSVLSIASRAAAKDDVLVIGDFNMPGVMWRVSGNGFLYPDPDRSVFHRGVTHILDHYSTATLKQVCSVVNDHNRSLDLCFVNSQDVAPSVSLAPAPLVKDVLHHPPLHVILDRKGVVDVHSTLVPVRYDFRNADFQSISLLLASMEWDDILDNEDVEAAALTFSHILGYVIDRHVPKKAYQNTGPPWQTTGLKKLKSQKRTALRRYLRHRTLPLRDYYVRLNSYYKNFSRQCFASYQHRIQQKLKSQPRAFWNFIKKQRNEQGLPSSMKWDGEVTGNRQRICEMFATKFEGVFSTEHLSPAQVSVAACNVPVASQVMSNVIITNDSILEATTKLKSSLCPGPDGIPSAFLKRMIDHLLSPLRLIFNLSLTSGTFPSCWKDTLMFPVHKKGDRRNIDNYRGISSLCAVSKLFELVVMQPLSFHCKQLISAHQHGFVAKRSTTTNLLCLTSYALDGMNERTQTDAIYLDLTAAFDKINHDIAVAKLDRIGVNGVLLRWFQSYLTGRWIRVSIGEHFSSSFSASSGIPQGSHLGPLIFLLYFNDVNEVIEGPRLSFADDFKMFLKVSSLADALLLQRQLGIFEDWCEINRMAVNPSKCSVISFSRIKNPITFNYTLCGVELERVSHVKDLGVILDKQLTFKQHVSYVIDKASRTLGFIFRIAKSFQDVYCLKALYCSLVRSTLEYCSTVWSPHFQNGVERIEAVQRRFIRYALRLLPWRDPMNLPSYENRCQLIHLETLKSRRDIAKALLVADILQGRVDCPEIMQQINVYVPPRTLRNHAMLRPPQRRTIYGSNSALIGLQRAFNRVAAAFDFNLSRNVLINSFKRILC